MRISNSEKKTLDNSQTSLRIAVVAHALRAAGGLSVGRNMIDALVRVAPGHEYCFIVPDGVGYEPLCACAPRSQVHLCRPMGVLGILRYDKYLLPRVIDTFKPDVVLALGNLGLLNPPCPQAVFLHQPHLLYPDKHFGPRNLKNKVRHRYLKWHFHRQLTKTQLILCQTQVVANRVRNIYGFSGRISVCGTSVSPSLLHSSTAAQKPKALASYNDRFKLLYITRYYPHKNIEGIVDLFHRYREELADVVVFLTIAPDQHPNAARILRRISKLGLRNHIVNLGLISHEHVGDYYRHSNALLMPTLLETFGIPYLEAMATDLPIMTSDLDFAHEVCGNAALYFDPWNAGTVKDAILQLKNDQELQGDLVEKGKTRLQKTFRSWDEIAGGVLGELELLQSTPL